MALIKDLTVKLKGLLHSKKWSDTGPITKQAIEFGMGLFQYFYKKIEARISK